MLASAIQHMAYASNSDSMASIRMKLDPQYSHSLAIPQLLQVKVCLVFLYAIDLI